MKALQDLSMRINTADCLEHLLDSILAGHQGVSSASATR